MFSNVFGCVACCLRWFSWGIPWLCMVQPSVISTCVYVCMGGGPHNFPRVPEYPVAAHAMFRVFGVDSVAHRVPRQTSMLEVSGCGAYCQTCFLDFSRGLSARPDALKTLVLEHPDAPRMPPDAPEALGNGFRMPPDAPGCPSRMPSQSSAKSVRWKGLIVSNAQSTHFPSFRWCRMLFQLVSMGVQWPCMA